jgi:cytochrome c-type biogenesis protein
MLGIFRIKALMKETRFQLVSRKIGVFGSFFVGMAFAFGWTPCTGPILTVVFAVAGESGSYGKALLTMTAYTLGLAIPFFIAALAVNIFLNWFNKFKQHFRKMEIFTGLLVIAVGVLIFFGMLTSLNRYFAGFSDLESRIEEGFSVSGEGISLLIAFIGGIVSFLSPCVLPLVPAYISYLSGVSLSELRGETK